MKSLYIVILLVLVNFSFAQEPSELLLELNKSMNEYDAFGYCASHAGDFDMDGYDDIIISDPCNGRGNAYLYLGNRQMDLDADYTITGQNHEGLLGKSVSFAGDVNNDGFSDIIVCAYDTSETGFYFTGKAALYFGNLPFLVDTFTPKLTFSDGKPGSGFGNCVKNAGDFNNDGYDDFVISAYCDDKKGTHTGRVYLYFGGPTMGTIPELMFTGEAEFNNFGTSLAFVGDVNNDGFSDIAIGAPGYEIAGETVNVGRIYIYFGNNTLDSNPDVIITGSGDQRIGHTIASAGDINNDGFDDIIVGAPYMGSAVGPSSYVCIYYGGTDMDATPDVIIENTLFNFGKSAACAGNMNHDDYDDIMVSDENNIYFFFGGTEMDTEPDYTLHISDYFDGIQSISLAGDVNYDGYKDILVSSIDHTGDTRIGKIYLYSGNLNTTDIKSEQILPTQYELFQNYPNPFNPTTTIRYEVPESGHVTITVYNMLGRKITTLVNGNQSAGLNKVEFNASDLVSGIYYYKMKTEKTIIVKKMILLK